jgi:hypothetical protein
MIVSSIRRGFLVDAPPICAPVSSQTSRQSASRTRSPIFFMMNRQSENLCSRRMADRISASPRCADSPLTRRHRSGCHRTDASAGGAGLTMAARDLNGHDHSRLSIHTILTTHQPIFGAKPTLRFAPAGTTTPVPPAAGFESFPPDPGSHGLVFEQSMKGGPKARAIAYCVNSAHRCKRGTTVTSISRGNDLPASPMALFV